MSSKELEKTLLSKDQLDRVLPNPPRSSLLACLSLR